MVRTEHMKSGKLENNTDLFLMAVKIDVVQ